jgi:hypothetical protein
MEEEEHIKKIDSDELLYAVTRFFTHQRDHGAGIRTQELEAAAIGVAGNAVVFPDEDNLGDILRLAMLSGSARLVATLPRANRGTALTTEQWQDHFSGRLCAGRADRVEAARAAMSRGLSVYEDLGAVFAQARKDPNWRRLLEAIACEQASFGQFMRPDQDVFAKGDPKDLAAFLTNQLIYFPDTTAESFEYAITGKLPALLGLICLLPVDPARIMRSSIPDHMHGIIDRLSSNHGELQIRAELGTLEEALSDIHAFETRAATALPRLGRRAGHNSSASQEASS